MASAWKQHWVGGMQRCRISLSAPCMSCAQDRRCDKGMLCRWLPGRGDQCEACFRAVSMPHHGIGRVWNVTHQQTKTSPAQRSTRSSHTANVLHGQRGLCQLCFGFGPVKRESKQTGRCVCFASALLLQQLHSQTGDVVAATRERCMMLLQQLDSNA